MRMLSVFAAVAVISIAAPAVAETAETSSFEHEGFTYVYKVEQKGNAQIITGKRYPGGARFSLRLRDGKVNGVSNGVAVNFDQSDAQGAAASAHPTALSMR